MAAKRVLIVDDVLETGRMMMAALKTLDAALEIKVVPSAEEALLEMANRPLNLLIADVRLPGMSGLDLVSRVHARNSQTRFLVATGWAGDDLPERVKAAGADRFLRKPLHLTEFLSICSELLDMQPPAVPVPTRTTARSQPRATGEVDLPGALLQLRNALGALLVLLADDTGKVLVQVGEQDSLNFEQDWAPVVMAALSTAQKAGRLVSPGMPKGALVLPGAEKNLVLAPVGNFALAILLGEDSSHLRTALALEEVLKAQNSLVGILDRIGAKFRPIGVTESLKQAAKAIVEKQIPAEEPAKVGTAELNELQKRLKRSEVEVTAKSADDYWETGLEEAPAALESAEVLSYEEARQLGLTPEAD